MKTKISNRKKIGFINYEGENAEVTEIVKEGVELINTKSEETKLSPEHLELIERIELTQSIIDGESFGGMSKEKKVEFKAELFWLSALHNRLLTTY